jgi:hypothetical protein
MDLSFLDLRSRREEDSGLTNCGFSRGHISFALVGHDRYQYSIYCFVRGCDDEFLAAGDDAEAAGGPWGTPDPITNQVQPDAVVEAKSEFITALDYRVKQASQSWNSRVCEVKAAINTHVRRRDWEHLGALRAKIRVIAWQYRHPADHQLRSYNGTLYASPNSQETKSKTSRHYTTGPSSQAIYCSSSLTYSSRS